MSVAPGLPKLAIPVAHTFVAVATAMYFIDLYQQTRDHLTNGLGRPLGDDFINFWSGAYLAWHGRVSEVYDVNAFHAFEQQVVGAPLDGYHYSYPPVLFLLTAPLALIPYVPALALWLTAGWYAFYRALRMALPGGGSLLLGLAAPAVFINAVGGQNGTWTAALFGGGLGLLKRNPLVAGGLLGLLVYKPQLGILIPIALIAGRHWRAFAAAAIVACTLVAVTTFLFGTEIWAEYMRNLSVLRTTILEDGAGVWHRFVSVFVAARRLGATTESAYLIQGTAAIFAGFAVALVWSRDLPAGIKNAVLLLSTCLATPYLQDYDLVFGVLAVAWLWKEPRATTQSEMPLQIAAGLLLLLPVLAALLDNFTGLSFGPLFIVPIFVVALHHYKLNDRPQLQA
jgi:hypothetical protein